MADRPNPKHDDAKASTGAVMIELLQNILTEMVGVNDALAELAKRNPDYGEHGTSSVEITKTSNGASYKVKAYAGSDITPVEDEALESFWRVGNRLAAGTAQQ